MTRLVHRGSPSEFDENQSRLRAVLFLSALLLDVGPRTDDPLVGLGEFPGAARKGEAQVIPPLQLRWRDGVQEVRGRTRDRRSLLLTCRASADRDQCHDQKRGSQSGPKP